MENYLENKMNKTIKILFIILLACSFFSINRGLPLNPVYIIGLVALFISFLYVDLKKIDKLFFVYIIYFFISLVFFLIGMLNFSKKYNDIVYLSSILYLYCILLGASVVLIGKKVNKCDRVKTYKIIFDFLIFYMFIDFIIRIVFSKRSGSFYDFKWGIFYFDSNFSALIILLFLMFAIYLKKNNIFELKKVKFIFLIFLLMTTFSRTAIFAFFVSYLLLRYVNKLIFPLIMFFLVISFYIFDTMLTNYMAGENFIGVDGSFNTKFYLISIAIDNYQFVPALNKWFGIGLANFGYYSDGIFAHNMLVTFFYEFGYLGIIGFLIFIFSCYLKIGRDIFYILLPFFIAGFSLFSAFIPFFFILISCLYIESNSLKKEVSYE